MGGSELARPRVNDKMLSFTYERRFEDKVCEEFVNEVNRMNLYQEKIKEMKSKIDIDLKV